MREFVVNEAELYQISLLHTLASGFFSAASASALFAIGLVTSAIIQGSLTEKGTVLLQLGVPFGGILTLAFAGAGWWATHKRSSILKDIKEGAVEIQQIPQPQISVTNPSVSHKEGSQT